MPEPLASLAECQAIPCRTCGAAAGYPCVFLNDRRNGARRGQSMGGSVHGYRSKAADAAHRPA